MSSIAVRLTPVLPAALDHVHRDLDAVVGAEIGPEQPEPDQHRPPATALPLNNGHPRAAVVPGGSGGSLVRPGKWRTRTLVRVSVLLSRSDAQPPHGGDRRQPRRDANGWA